MSEATDWSWASDWPAPAKLNLFLHVVGRRADGYHLLQTLFRFVDHGDLLRFAPRGGGEVVLATPLPGVAPETDLTVRAARLLQAETGCRDGVTITLEKRLPMGGGLGGGSSDAATVLLALNHLWGLGLPRQRLQALGLTLGADVPIFVYGRNAFAEGVGEAFTPVDVPAAWYVVLEPPVSVPTVDIFRSPRLRRDSPAISARQWRPGFGGNDLQPVAVALHPAVGEALGWLSAFGEARMTGSGACVFAEFATRQQAEAVLAQLPGGLRGWVAPGLPAHPLVGLCAP
ncbi:MAG: 4-(cytidine 5'-diphospho)-2-C-methyl-D-erythritol kinase [Rhodocyclales bacterium]|nr:4-(cytidine 5'-diphospho)-2-C-methyl-D-erythritol kinase [Rhodocyclales bacterium]